MQCQKSTLLFQDLTTLLKNHACVGRGRVSAAEEAVWMAVLALWGVPRNCVRIPSSYHVQEVLSLWQQGYVRAGAQQSRVHLPTERKLG